MGAHEGIEAVAGTRVGEAKSPGSLHEGGNHIVWFGLSWNLEQYQQANARLYRQGQKQAVRIYHILAKDTIDEKVLEVLKGKNLRQEKLLQELKAEIEKGAKS